MIATEILSAQELWSVTETIMNNRENFLTPFWDAVVPSIAPSTPSTDSMASQQEQSERHRARDEFWSNEDEERDRRREIIRGMWVKVNGTLLVKRPIEVSFFVDAEGLESLTLQMLRFIQGLPDIIERLMARIESPAIQDMLFRIFASEEPNESGVMEWLSAAGVIPQLISLLSPYHPHSTHVIATELLQCIIDICAPISFNPAGGNVAQENGYPANRDNRLIRELVSEESIRSLVGFMLDPLDLTDTGPDKQTSPFVIQPLPSVSSSSSSISNISTILIEINRRNNSDFSEPHLFHSLRNHLMHIQMQHRDSDSGQGEEAQRQRMEDAMTELSTKMGIVHLGQFLTIPSERFGELHGLLMQPRSQTLTASNSAPTPLTFERFRIVELYAEMLHTSNMSIHTRPPGTGPPYSADGILSGGLDGLEALGAAMEGDSPNAGDDNVDEDAVTQARELPVSSGSTTTDSEDEAEFEDIDTTPSQSPMASTMLINETNLDDPVPDPISVPPSSADAAVLRDVMTLDPIDSPSTAVSEVGSHVPPATVASETPQDYETVPSTTDEPLSPGDRLKQMYIKHRVLPDVVDLFFEYPSNDFLHHVVHDMLLQILNGRLTPGMNRELIIELFCNAKLADRLLEAQRQNDSAV